MTECHENNGTKQFRANPMQQPLQPLVPAPLTYKPENTRTNLFTALMRASSEFGAGKPVLVDGDERVLTYKEIIRAVFGLGSALRKGTRRGEAVGVMLPTGAGAVIGFFALTAYGRVPAMLNFTSGSKNLKAAMRAAKVRRMITARKFVELGGLEDLISELSKSVEVIYLEDVREKLNIGDKIAALAGPLVPSLVASRLGSKQPGVILFTSGTEGEPKGVVLSHENIMANIEQVRAHIGLSPDTDIVFNPLPTFHCFGLTVGALLPLIGGLKVIFHPSPLQPKEIVRRIRESGATILLATDTFISQYARTGTEGDLDSIRLAVCGAERVKDETRAYVRRKYSIEILEGYGATEAAPVVAANQWEQNKPGTVGRLMAGMESKLVPVEGMPEGGRLHIRGPNVMMGYLRPSNPGAIERLRDGWHDTGDIVDIDGEGFIRILGRVKRFAKIGGEMVSLAVVENCAAAVWPDHMHAAVTLPDPKKGEQVVLLSDAPEAARTPILEWAQSQGVPEISVPRRVFKVSHIPVLGTGKVDYAAVRTEAERLMND